MKSHALLAPLAGLLSLVNAIDVDLTSINSIKDVTSSLAYDMMTYYSGNLTGMVPGILPGPCESLECYYWWEAGAMWGALINYWQYTGDTSYNPTITQALAFQIGPDENYNPPNQSKNMGVDDQGFWAFAAMDAAEANFPEAGGDIPSWVALAQAVYNFQMPLWDDKTCGGGMRWQVYSFNQGYNLKNTVSNGGNFQLAARLARYTGNQSYADWAEKMWNWIEASPLFQEADGVLYVWDNTDTENNCADTEHHAWSYNYGTLLAGCAYMYNYTNGNQTWHDRIEKLLTGTYSLFFPQQYGGGNIMTEFQCEESMICNNDQSSFKAYLSRWLAVTAILVPDLWDQIMPKLQTSAAGAAQQCTGGDNGRQCGRKWYSSWDGSKGVGQQMQALSVIGATTIHGGIAPKTLMTGATSQSDPDAGSDTNEETTVTYKPITTADKAGAGILTALVIVGMVGASVWLIL